MMLLAFFPFGAFLAGLFLGAVITIFAVALHGLSRAATRTSGSILPGMVAGFRGWSDDRLTLHRPATSPPVDPMPDESGPEVIDLQ